MTTSANFDQRKLETLDVLDVAKFIPWLPFLGAILCALCCLKPTLRKLAAPICVLSLGGAFVLSVIASQAVSAFDAARAVSSPAPGVVTAWNWIEIGGLRVGMSYFLDPLTVIMLFVVTGIGTLVAIYASGYMKGDPGYARFFAAVCLFIFAMTTLILADNLVLMYLGWEGVGLCSYLLIGFYYHKPSAVAAAKKAFIVNRVGDLGFALGIFLTWQRYDTVNLPAIAALAPTSADQWMDAWIPFLLMLGAFGKSAQLPLYVWLPDAMEGPTPVSALIHAATMVTAGVYMIARLMPLFDPALSPHALEVVAIVGGLTALFAATIALCQYDIKRIYAYSTISQLGYMFLGVGVASTVGGVFHLFTHAFFKALLFLTAGSVMHALAGQLDLRKMSGLRKKMPVTCWLMFVGCLALAGFPLTAGFFSKDLILGDVMARAYVTGADGHHHLSLNLYFFLAILGLFTAFLTAFYTFRLWFRVFMGEEKYEMGQEHGHEESHEPLAVSHEPKAGSHQLSAVSHQHADHGHNPKSEIPNPKSEITIVHHHEPHEMPWLMNAPLVVLAIGAIAAGFLCKGWIANNIGTSTAAVAFPADEHAIHAGHGLMMTLSIIVALLGIALAAVFHWLNRPLATRVAAKFPSLVRILENKWYVDEFYNKTIVVPLRLIGELCFAFDRLVIEPLVAAPGFLLKQVAIGIRPMQRGVLQGYGLSMVAGAAIVLVIVLWKMAG